MLPLYIVILWKNDISAAIISYFAFFELSELEIIFERQMFITVIKIHSFWEKMPENIHIRKLLIKAVTRDQVLRWMFYAAIYGNKLFH